MQYYTEWRSILKIFADFGISGVCEVRASLTTLYLF